MPLDTTKIVYGASVPSIGDYVAAGGAGTLVDVGHLLGGTPVELGSAMENFDIESDRAQGLVATSPTKTDFTVKIPFLQAEAEWLRIGLAQPAANKTGTGANLTLRVGDRVTQYHQITLVVLGPGTTGVRTITIWRAQVISMEPIQFGKQNVQAYIVTFRILRDDSVTTADKYWKQVDA